MRIGVDAMGGDFAPLEAIKGAVLAKSSFPDVEIVLYGDKQVIDTVAQDESLDLSRVEIVHCTEVIEMSEHPVKAIASKRDSSIFKGFLDLASKKTDAFTSAGNTGAMLVGSIQILKPIAGVERPCLIAGVPKPSGNHGVILDVGANSDTKPEHLQQFAVLGSVYAKSILKMENPRVGLLNIGEEEEKGSILTKAAHQLLKSTFNINFVGNVEGRKVFDDEADVLVCDGFTGNVVLKVIEGFYYHLAVRGVNDDFMNLLNFKHHGGGLVLGVNAPVVVGHGISKSSTIVKMIELCINSVKSKYCDHVADAFRHVTAQNNQS